MAELKYWVWLATRKGVGARNMGELLRYFGSPEDIFFARKNDYAKAFGGDTSPLEDKDLSGARRIIADCGEAGASILTLGDAMYPARLKNIIDPPVVLYVKGKLPFIDEEVAISIVGTRSCTPYGIKIAEKMAYEITRTGGLVISGLARGIDSAAARGALRAGGKVVGVLGCGIDVVYPASNERLFWDVKEFGALISEYPPGTRPDKGNFPARNRILSGLSLGVVVVEAPERSGALITASRALEQGRDVFAVPGNVDADACRGSNILLKEGAQPVTRGRDVTEMYATLYPDKYTGLKKLYELDERGSKILVERELSAAEPQPKKTQKEPKKAIDNKIAEDYIDISVKPEDLSAEELQVLGAMTEKSIHVDDIIEKCSMSAAEVLSALTMLEINGVVTQEPGKRFTAHIKI